MFALPILSHVLKAYFFKQNSPKVKLILQKNAKFSSAEGSAPVPPAAGGFAPDPQNSPPIANFWVRA